MSQYSTVLAGIHAAIAAIPSAAALPLIDALDDGYAIEQARTKGRTSLLLIYSGRQKSDPQPLSSWTQNNLVQNWRLIIFALDFQGPADLEPLETIADDLLAIRGTVLANIGSDDVRLLLESVTPQAISSDTARGGELALILAFRTTEFYS